LISWGGSFEHVGRDEDDMVIENTGVWMVNRKKRRVMRDAIRAAVFAIAGVAVSAPLLAQSAAQNPDAACAAKNENDSAVVGTVTFTAYQSNDGACLLVMSGGNVVYRNALDSFEKFTLGQPGDPQYAIPAIVNGTDVTGRGHPDMIVSLFTGGAHCCTVHYVFEIEPTAKLLATLNDSDDDLAHFEQDPVDKRYSYITADWTFAYWPSCFACSPSALVKLRWVDDGKGGGFHLAMDKMQTPAPPTAEWNKDLSATQKAVSAGSVDDIGQPLWGTVLNLIYTAHSDLAWKFLDSVEAKAQEKPFPSLADFCSLLKKSPYWPDLQPTLKSPPATCINAAPAATK
jgi:hypothetical protein